MPLVDLNQLSINGAVENTAPSIFDDYLAFYDASAAVNKRVKPRNLPTLNPRNHFFLYNDFNNVLSTADGLAQTAAGTGGAGSGVSVASVWAYNVIGSLNLTTGSTATGRAGIYTNAANLHLATGRWFFNSYVFIATVSDATNSYTLYSGLSNNPAAVPTYYVGFRYTHSVNGGSWQCVCRANNIETVINTTASGNTNTAYQLEFLVNAAGTSVQFWINGIDRGSITTNIPGSAGGHSLGIQPINIIKSAGLGAKSVQIDYILVLGEFTTPR